MSSETGYAAAAVAVFFFGTNFVPAKRCNPGDGVFFQWIMAGAIWTVGMCVQLARDSPQFEPLAMVGGMLWVLGNTMCVPVIQLIGMGLGVLVWGATNLVVGWMSGKFGFFGITRDHIDHPELNAIGAAICLSSLAAFFFVEPSTAQDDKEARALRQAADEEEPYGALLSGEPVVSDGVARPIEPVGGTADGGDGGLMDRLNRLPKTRRSMLGFGLAGLAGALFGLNFVPPQYLMDHHEDAFGKSHSTHAMDYVFSHFSGIFLTATAVFLIYTAARGNRPYMPNNLVLPAFACGTMWAIAQVAWFVANQELQFVVAYPMVTTGPGFVSALWGAAVFGEIRGRRNFAFLGLAFGLIVTGVTIISLST